MSEIVEPLSRKDISFACLAHVCHALYRECRWEKGEIYEYVMHGLRHEEPYAWQLNAMREDVGSRTN